MMKKIMLIDYIMKLLKIVKSTNNKKKLDAIFLKDNGKEKKTSFGAKGYNDYTLTGDKLARDRYRKRHIKDLKTGDPTRAGYLSYYILWGNSTDLNTNIRNYKSRFKL
tara:strand:+ start:1796 stop:2119 length:324 start_codon:yes stop_codon:yes gene_type:complete